MCGDNLMLSVQGTKQVGKSIHEQAESERVSATVNLLRRKQKATVQKKRLPKDVVVERSYQMKTTILNKRREQ